MTSNRLYGPLDDVSADAGYANDHPSRVGFFTDTSVCIGCKACEVACKEWNGLPDPDADLLTLTGMSYDNTGALGSESWRHVAFIEQAVPPASALSRDADGDLIISALVDGSADGDSGATRWLMASDVCKHCTHAGCLDVCPTGALVRTEFGTVIVQPDVCNGCAYCVSACPFGVIDRREDDGRAWKCTMCYDRLRGGLEPACAKACPTDSIQFGDIDELRTRAEQRVQQLHARGVKDAYLYGADASHQPGTEGLNAFFLLCDKPEVYNLPPDPVVPTKKIADSWWAMASGIIGLGVVAIGAVLSARSAK